MSKYQPPKTAAIGVPKLNKEYYMHLVPGGSLELNVGKYDYGWYACKCVAVTGKTDDDCAFVVEFEEAYKDTRFQKGWKFDDPMEQDTFDNISDNGRCLFYYGLLTKEDGFFVRSTKKKTSSYVTTAVLKKQQRRDEKELGAKETEAKRRKTSKSSAKSILEYHDHILSSFGLFKFCERKDLMDDLMENGFYDEENQFTGTPEPTVNCWALSTSTSKRKSTCVITGEQIPANVERIDIQLKPWNDEEWVEEFCDALDEANYAWHALMGTIQMK